MFCSQYLQSMLYGPTVQMCRISMAESERFPEQSALYYDVLFTEVHTRVNAYLKATFRLSSKASAEAAQKLLGRVLFPRFPRVLFGLDPPMNTLEPEALSLVLDLKPIRKAVSELIGDLVS